MKISKKTYKTFVPFANPNNLKNMYNKIQLFFNIKK
jgi:hypothetical protein